MNAFDYKIDNSIFTETKYSSVMRIIRELENAKTQTPQLEKALNCHILSLALQLLWETPENSIFERNLFEEVKKYRKAVITDSNVQMRIRLASLVSFSGVYLLRKLTANLSLGCGSQPAMTTRHLIFLLLLAVFPKFATFFIFI